MVRPDVCRLSASLPGKARDLSARCVELAGASPALVIAGEPGSRLPPSSEISPVKRSVESSSMAVRLSGEEQSRGPSHKRTLQPRDRSPRKGGDGRADHVTAKATDCIWNSGWMQDPPGVWRRARDESSTRNRRGPHRLPTLGEGDAYKRNAKWHRGGRESERLIVLLTSGESRNEERGLALVALVRGGKGEGMA